MKVRIIATHRSSCTTSTRHAAARGATLSLTDERPALADNHVRDAVEQDRARCTSRTGDSVVTMMLSR